MAYSGTGTENDPYKVNTFEDFKNCAEVSDAYVKVTSDIDARIDTTYPTYKKIQIKAAKIYADALTKISGFIVNDATCIYGARENTIDIENIHFDDILFKPVYSGNMAVIGALNNSVKILFTNCECSIDVSYGQDNTHKISAIDYGSFYNCSIYIRFIVSDFTGKEYSRLFGSTTTFHNSIIEIVDYPIYYSETSVNNISLSEYSVFKISFKIYNDSISSNSITFLNNTDSHDNIWILMHSKESPGESTLPKVYIRGISNIVDASIDDYTLNFTDSTRSHKLTTDQIKSEEYLQEIGFIP